VADKVIFAYFKFFFSGFYILKIIKIGSFLTELLKIKKNVIVFFETRCIISKLLFAV